MMEVRLQAEEGVEYEIYANNARQPVEPGLNTYRYDHGEPCTEIFDLGIRQIPPMVSFNYVYEICRAEKNYAMRWYYDSTGSLYLKEGLHGVTLRDFDRISELEIEGLIVDVGVEIELVKLGIRVDGIKMVYIVGKCTSDVPIFEGLDLPNLTYLFLLGGCRKDVYTIAHRCEVLTVRALTLTRGLIKLMDRVEAKIVDVEDVEDVDHDYILRKVKKVGDKLMLKQREQSELVDIMERSRVTTERFKCGVLIVARDDNIVLKYVDPCWLQHLYMTSPIDSITDFSIDQENVGHLVYLRTLSAPSIIGELNLPELEVLSLNSATGCFHQTFPCSKSRTLQEVLVHDISGYGDIYRGETEWLTGSRFFERYKPTRSAISHVTHDRPMPI